MLEKIAFSYGVQRSVKMSVGVGRPPRPVPAACVSPACSPAGRRADTSDTSRGRPMSHIQVIESPCAGARACGQVIESIADDLIVSLKHIPDILMDKRALKARTEGLRGRRWGVRVGRVVILVGGDRRRWMGQGR